MKKRWKLLSIWTVFMLLVTGICNGSFMTCYASEEEGTKWYVYVNDEVPEITMGQGETKDVTIELKANYAKQIDKIVIDTKDTPFSLQGKPKLFRQSADSTVNTIGQDKCYLRFTLKAKKSTEEKTYHLPVSFLAYDGFGADMNTYTLLDSIPVTYETEKSADGKASLTISGITCKNDLKSGESTNVAYSVNNTGDGKASDITITYDGFGDDGILPGNNGVTKKISSFDGNSVKSFTYPVKAGKNAVTGAKKLTITVSYKRSKGDTEYVTETESFYIQVEGKETQSQTTVKAPKIIITDIHQSHKEPKAGENIALCFTAVNVGQKAAKNITIVPVGLSNAAFIPLDENPNTFIKTLKAGESKKITLNYGVSENIEGGLNSIEYAAAYKDINGADYSDNVKVYVKNVKAKKEKDSKGVPKLIIEKYSTGGDIVTAGGVFTFAFDIANTHTALSADNIKVTVTSDEAGTFSVAKGSNSFYLSSIAAGSSVHKEIPIKVKADCTTKAYPLKVEFEYEYKGMEKPKDTLTSGLTVAETLNIQVEEDSRPALTNILPGAYGELYNGEMNSVTFDFTNRGKSPLYNVEVTISGDFEATQESYFIGTVEAGTGSNHEMEITPLTEGTATGLMTVTYEDSNGKKGKIEQEFSGEVMSSSGAAMGEDGMNPGMDGMEPEKEAKKPLIGVPLFCVLEPAGFFAAAFAVYKFKIRRYKKKRLLEEEQEL